MQRSLEILAKKFAGTEQTFDGFFYQLSAKARHNWISVFFTVKCTNTAQFKLNYATVQWNYQL